MRKLFGTDGIRGTANQFPVTAELAMKVGMAAGAHFHRGSHRNTVVIAKDTRLSGYMIEPALTSGFVSVGMDVVLVGPMPTPAVAQLVRSLRADLGVMISASHNPYHDNGIKLFGPDGYKLSDEVELAIEANVLDCSGIALAAPDQLGRAKRLDDAPGRYIEFVKNTFPRGMRLDGLKIVVDCANGAAYHLAPKVFWELGAEVLPIGVEPNGFNINDGCGSTHPEKLCAEVITRKADLGIALDGDADRLVMCDERGQLIDGDQLMAMIATYWHTQGLLKGGAVAATLMSNLGFERYLETLGLKLLRAKVGDRYVMEAMREAGCNIGGEPSGHIILNDYSTTGDGIVAALQVLAVVKQSGQRMSECSEVFKPYPQVMKNVKFKGANPLDAAGVKETIAAQEKKLGKSGRIVVRKSGTEPLVRVMAEGESRRDLEAVVAEIVSAMESELGKKAKEKAA